MPAATIITTKPAMITAKAAMIDGLALAKLLAFASPAFPTGGFAYSHGLEWAVQAGEIVDAGTLQAWLHTVLTHGGGRSDAILLRHAHRAGNDDSALADLAALAAASAPAAERRLETLAQGSAFAQAALAWGAVPASAAYPVVFGAVVSRQGIGEYPACIAYLSAFLGNLVSAGVRLVPLGQSAGLAVTAALQPVLLAVAADAATAGLDDLGGACFFADICAMLHETQYSRMFRS